MRGGDSKGFSGPSQTKVGEDVCSQISSAPSPPCWASKQASRPGSLAIWLRVDSNRGRLTKVGRSGEHGRRRQRLAPSPSALVHVAFPLWLQPPLRVPPPGSLSCCASPGLRFRSGWLPRSGDTVFSCCPCGPRGQWLSASAALWALTCPVGKLQDPVGQGWNLKPGVCVKARPAGLGPQHP